MSGGGGVEDIERKEAKKRRSNKACKKFIRIIKSVYVCVNVHTKSYE